MAAKKKASPSATKLLCRSETNRVIGGVAGGLAEYLDVDPTLIRLAFIIITLAGGSGVLLYIILWLVIPSQSQAGGVPSDHVRENAKEIKLKAQEFAKNVKISKMPSQTNTKQIIGLLLLGLGLVFLLENFGIFPFLRIDKLWPLILVLIAFAILRK